jgi:hypothetical protein
MVMGPAANLLAPILRVALQLVSLDKHLLSGKIKDRVVAGAIWILGCQIGFCFVLFDKRLLFFCDCEHIIHRPPADCCS